MPWYTKIFQKPKKQTHDIFPNGYNHVIYTTKQVEVDINKSDLNISETFKNLINKTKTKALSINSINKKTEGNADGVIFDYNLRNVSSNKVVAKSFPTKGNKSLIYYEVAIADLMQKLGLKVAKKTLISAEKNPTQSFVVSEWESELISESEALKKCNDVFKSLKQNRATPQEMICTWVELYKQEIDPKQKDLYKMCACLNASGMMDLKPSENIKQDKKGNFIVLDTGYSLFTQWKRPDWQNCIDVLKNDKNEEIREWGSLIEKYKNFAINFIETETIVPTAVKPAKNTQHEARVDLSKITKRILNHLESIQHESYVAKTILEGTKKCNENNDNKVNRPITTIIDNSKNGLNNRYF